MSQLTAGVTGKGGIWRTKPPDAESAVWGRDRESVGECPHLSGARGVGPVLQGGLEFEPDTEYIGGQVLAHRIAAFRNDASSKLTKN